MQLFWRMSIFNDLMNRIRGHAAREQEAQTNAAVAANAPAAATPSLQEAPSATAAPVDVEAVLTDIATKSGKKFDWRYSIVDLMSMLGMESSLAHRKELAKELGYTGDTSDSATMNIWLHKQVMTKMAENGGIVPADLLS